MLKKILPPIHPEGYIFGVIFFVVTLLLWHLSHFLGCIGLILTAWCLYFFRNPDRITPDHENLIISPADGVISQIKKMAPPEVLKMGSAPCYRISVFMNVFNVHVNRSPISGTVKTIHYHAGKFINASLDKASDHNERQYFMVENKDLKVGFCQIAGLIARRIRCDIQVDDTIKAGERFGLIRFGSRVDVYLPESITPRVIEGQIAIAGETILADTKNKAAPYKGVVR